MNWKEIRIASNERDINKDERLQKTSMPHYWARQPQFKDPEVCNRVELFSKYNTHLKTPPISIWLEQPMNLLKNDSVRITKCTSHSPSSFSIESFSNKKPSL